MIHRKVPLLLLFIVLSTAVFCEEEPFRGWKRTETEHFVFIFEEKDRESVYELRSFAEETYDRLTFFFDSYPKKIRCVVSGRVDTVNGYFSPLPAHMNLYLKSPSVPTFGSEHSNWLRLLFTHELTHYIHMTYEKGFFYVLSLIFGEEVRPSDMVFLPGWMIEGIAVELEERFTDGGRGKSPFFELYYKAPLIENELFTLQQASYSSPYPPSGRIYVAGYMIISYILEEYGSDIFREIHRRFAAFPFIGPRRAIKLATGKTAAQIFYTMKRTLEAKYAAEMRMPDAKKITPDTVGDYHSPLFTEAGLSLYRSTLDERPAVVTYDLDTGEEKVITKVSLTDYSSYTVSEDGSQIVFATGITRYNTPAGINYSSDLFSCDTTTGKRKRITKDANLSQPALSPVGSLLIAVQHSGPYSRLVVIDRETGSAVPLVEEPYSTVYNPSFSPDGSKICCALKKGAVQDIWVLNVDEAVRNSTSDKKPLTIDSPFLYRLTGPDVEGDFFPRFIDDQTVLFTSDREGSLALYSVEIEERRVYRILRDRIGAFQGDYHKNRLYYASYGSDGFVVKVADTTERVDVTELFETNDTTKGTTGPKTQPVFDRSPEAEIGTISPYVDFPKPLFWLPVPFYANPISGIEPVFGAGFYAIGSSYLGYSNWEATITSRFDVFQPAADIYTSIRLGIVDVYYGLGQGYVELAAGNNYQVTNHGMGVTLPIIESARFSTSSALSVSAGINHRFRLIGEDPFPFFGAGGDYQLTSDHKVSIAGGIKFSITQLRSPKALFYPLQVKGSITASVPIPVGIISSPGFDATGIFSFTFPGFSRHHSFKIGLKSDYITPALLQQTGPISSVSPRGMYGAELMTTEGKVLASLEYLFNIALLDQPLPLGYNMFGLNIQRIGGGFHVEMTAHYGIAAPSFSLDENVYVGAEFVMELGAALSSIPIGTGISFRFDRQFRRTPDIDDLGLYFFVGTDSFHNTSFRATLSNHETEP